MLQFDIKTLLGLTALVGFVMTFATIKGGWLFAFLVTFMLATFGSAVLALIWFVFIPRSD